ncbi:IclR family transcriptional regulator [Gulosibacter molinativorax]|uniref:IclR family transcriptional regulator n=1 Tax=Gulosibacter molinativorax TaxID=256821 RepID=A0ABT7CBX5_9MICO|nr:IclR family transcriptional regulator C-terminal domain-containing protein [Gulosibacter molinativorax]MDJ1372701.1 hypothetical protein [Gulosibacter molinativorax]QUY63180.1 Hypotetical protein [Gulosibacter molinativorax]
MEISQTADYALQVLFALETKDAQTASDLATTVGVARSVMQRILNTLHGRALVTRDPAGNFRLSPLLVRLAGHIPNELATVGQPIIDQLAASIGETVILTVPEDHEAVVVARAHAAQSTLRIEYEVGFRQPITRGASSLAMLAHLDAGTLGLTLHDDTSLQLKAIRQRGVSRSRGHVRPEMSGIGAPVLDTTSGLRGAVAIVVPTSRAERLEHFEDALLATAGTIATALEAGERV